MPLPYLLLAQFTKEILLEFYLIKIRIKISPFCLSVQEIIPGGVLLPYVTVVLEAVRSDNKKQGYSVSLYEKRDYYKAYFKIVASKLNQTQWRACLDSLVQPFRFQVFFLKKNSSGKVALQLNFIALYNNIFLKTILTPVLYVFFNLRPLQRPGNLRVLYSILTGQSNCTSRQMSSNFKSSLVNGYLLKY